MDPLDHRHGTQAGHSQHRRDGEDPCPACIEGDLKAARRRRKRTVQGYEHQRAVGQRIYTKIANLRDEGVSIHQLAEWADVGFRSMYAVVTNGPTQLVYAKTWLKLNDFKPGPHYTNRGLTRRIQALHRLGYSIPALSRETGLSEARLIAIRDGRIAGPTTYRVREAIANAYDRLQMRFPEESTTGQRKGVTRARNTAIRNGWPTPMAWDDIDTDARPHAGPDRWGRTRDADVDPVVVTRILAGDWRLPCTAAEKAAVVAAWDGSHYRLAQLTGWKVERYTEREDGAA